MENRRACAQCGYRDESHFAKPAGADGIPALVVEMNAFAVYPLSELTWPLPEIAERPACGRRVHSAMSLASPHISVTSNCGSWATDRVCKTCRSADRMVRRPKARLMSAFGTQ